MQTASPKLIRKTFQKISDLVTPTMGAKGRVAIIDQEMDKPMVTDDGVTVARECRNLTGFERTIAISMIEAAATTEKEAYDGTTLTILLTNEFYKAGLKWTKPRILGGKGLHPQEAADYLLELASRIRSELKQKARRLTDDDVYKLATITTKIPFIAKLVHEAYMKAGPSMNIVIEHNRETDQTYVEHTEGLVIDSGYFSETMKQLCNDGDKTVFDKPRAVLLSEDLLTREQLIGFLQSIPKENINDQYVFFITKRFNPQSLKLLLDALIGNNMQFQFVFINEENPEEIFLDIAAKTGGQIQDAAKGTSNYLFKHTGNPDKIIIEQDKTIIINDKADKAALEQRIQSYEKELEKNKYTLGINRLATINRRLSSLKTGLVKIRLAVPTITEFTLLKLKLDDAVGAVKQALKNGYLLGGGKELANLSRYCKGVKDLKKALVMPMLTIAKNAGRKVPKGKIWSRKAGKQRELGLDVVNGKIGCLPEMGIIDSFDSIDASVKNAASIAASYLRAYTIIRKNYKS